jgi:hypothetical protein
MAVELTLVIRLENDNNIDDLISDIELGHDVDVTDYTWEEV